MFVLLNGRVRFARESSSSRGWGAEIERKCNNHEVVSTSLHLSVQVLRKIFRGRVKRLRP